MHTSDHQPTRRRRGRPSKAALAVIDNLAVPDEPYAWELELLAPHLRLLEQRTESRAPSEDEQ